MKETKLLLCAALAAISLAAAGCAGQEAAPGPGPRGPADQEAAAGDRGDRGSRAANSAGIPDAPAPELPEALLAVGGNAAARERSASRLKPGDLVQIAVYNHQDLSMVLRVPREGYCSFPLLGRIDLAGLEIREVETSLKERLEKDFLTYAHVSAYVREWAPRTAYILGAVVQPGSYAVDPAEGLTLLKLIAMARGFAPDADKERVRLIRESDSGGDAYTIPVLSMMNGRLSAMDVDLLPGDRVLVQPLRKVFVLGAVRSPGGIAVSSEEPPTLTRAISTAGGFNPDADRTGLLLVRSGAGGESVILLDYSEVEEGRDSAADALLSPGDTLIVRTRERVFVLGSVNQPGGFLDAGSGLTATKAVSMAGGFSKRADVDGTIVVRVRGGKKIVIPVKVSAVVSEDPGSDVTLLPGDIVYVPERFF